MSEISFDGTGLTLIGMMLYGFIAILSSKIIFDWKIAVGGILLIFLIEIVASWVKE